MKQREVGMPRIPGSIMTSSGILISVVNPKLSDFKIEDCAHALSRICRFGGHLSRFYSVAQHSLLVSFICPMENALEGLLHDRSEAYGLGDMPSPIKRLPELEGYRGLEAMVNRVSAEAWGVPAEKSEAVHEGDQLARMHEAYTWHRQGHKASMSWAKPLSGVLASRVPHAILYTALDPDEAEVWFLRRYETLTASERLDKLPLLEIASESQ